MKKIHNAVSEIDPKELANMLPMFTVVPYTNSNVCRK